MNSAKSRLLYIGDRQSLHHKRFIDALSGDFEVSTEFIEEERANDEVHLNPELVICAPLSTPLVYAKESFHAPIIGVCWAQELNEPRAVLQEDSQFASAIAGLSGIITDNKYTESLLRDNMNYQGPIEKITFNLEPSNLPKFKERKHVRPIFVTARKFEPLYRNDLVLDALRILGGEFDLQLVSIGGGSQFEAMKDRFKSEIESDLFRFTGESTSRQTQELMAGSDFYISASRSDGVSVTLLEAMSLGKVCLVSNFPSNLEVIEDGVNGFVFENENVDSLIAKCRELILLETSVITKLSKNAIHTVEERFNWKKSRLALVSFVKSFLGKNE